MNSFMKYVILFGLMIACFTSGYLTSISSSIDRTEIYKRQLVETRVYLLEARSLVQVLDWESAIRINKQVSGKLKEDKLDRLYYGGED